MSELLTVSLVAVVAVFINRLLQVRESRLRSARSVTATVQRAVLPEPPARVGDLRIAACYEAAEAEAEIGGDLYAVQDTPYGLRCVVGDVRGKGLDAVEAATLVLGTFRMAADERATLSDVAGQMHQALRRELGRRDEGERLEWFATAVLAEFPHGGEYVRLVNLGHPAPLLLRGGQVRAVEPSEYGLLLVEGLGEAVGEGTWWWTRCRSRRVRRCCCAPTASPRPVTRGGASTTRRPGWPGCSATVRPVCWRRCSRTCTGTRAARRTTTWHSWR